MFGLDTAGTSVFALGGAVAGMDRRQHLFGLLVLSFVAGRCGGIVRDILIVVSPRRNGKLALSGNLRARRADLTGLF